MKWLIRNSDYLWAGAGSLWGLSAIGAWPSDFADMSLLLCLVCLLTAAAITGRVEL